MMLYHTVKAVSVDITLRPYHARHKRSRNSPGQPRCIEYRRLKEDCIRLEKHTLNQGKVTHNSASDNALYSYFQFPNGCRQRGPSLGCPFIEE
eukprot:2923560-Rhodomonas_salina.2